MTEGTIHHSEVPSAAPYELDRAGFNKMKKTWEEVDLLDARRVPLEERRRLSEKCHADAEFCRQLLTDERSFLLQHRTSKRTSEIHHWEANLRLQSIYLVPEDMDDAKADDMVEAALLITKELGPRWQRDFDDMSTIGRLHDAMALDVLWKARSATTENGKQLAKAMHASVIMSSVQEIVAMSKRLEQATGRITPKQFIGAIGSIGEFMKVTWERLNVHLNEDPDALSRVFVRLATEMEDRKVPKRAGKNHNTDAAIHNLRRGATRAVQYKALADWRGSVEEQKQSIEESYDKVVTIDYIENLGLLLHDVTNIARLFNILVSSKTTGKDRAEARLTLATYFNRPQVETMSG